MPLTTAAPLSAKPLLAKSAITSDPSLVRGLADQAAASRVRDWRLHKHADYQRVYQASRKQFSAGMSYFVAAQPAESAGAGPRVGITAGKVLGKAVERNRIKRRMRAAIVGNLNILRGDLDVVLHPKRSVLMAEWTSLDGEIRRIFTKIQESAVRTDSQPERQA